MDMFWGYFLIFIIVFPLGIWSFSYALGLLFSRGVPYVPLSKFQLSLVEKHIKLKRDDRVADLGCGDGRVLRLFEKQGIESIEGYEINFWAYLKARLMFSWTNARAKIYYKNFFKVDLGKYNVVFCYLFDHCLARLRNKFDKELKPGSLVISFGFPIANWLEPEIIYADNKNKFLNRMFIYHIR